MAMPAQAGLHDDGRETYGHSLIVDPWGKVLADAGTQLGLIYGEIDVHAVAATRGRIPNLKNARPFDVRFAEASVVRAAE